jgi:hypothetical protein
MKILSTSLLLILAGAAAQAQTPPKAPTTPAPVAVPAPASAPRIVTEFMISGETSMIKGQPFSAEAVSESVQTLADGNRIVRKWSNKLYRDSQGRFRREGANGASSMLGAALSGENAVSIIDPSGSRFYLNTDDQTARVITLPSIGARVNGQNTFVLKSGMDAAKIQEELKARGVQGVNVLPAEKAITVTTPGAVVSVSPAERLAGSAVIVGSGSGIGAGSVVGYATAAGTTKYDTKTESLGTQDFEGVLAEGSRTTTTIPADAIGNERPIEIVYERWYSKELGMLVYSRHSDPRFGEQTYRLTNINRSEPDPSLFEVPPGYKVLNEPSTTFYRSIAPKPAAAPAKVYTTAPATKP